MWNPFKKKSESSISETYFSSGKKKTIWDTFRVDIFVLSVFILLIFVTFYSLVEIKRNTLEIQNREETLRTDYQLLLKYSETIGFLNGLQNTKVSGKKIISYLDYLDSINLPEYEVKYDGFKKYFFVRLDSVNQGDYQKFIEEGKKQRILNFVKTNQTIKIREEGRISAMLIFR